MMVTMLSSWAAPELPVMVRKLDVLLVGDQSDDVLVGGTRISCCHEDDWDGDEDMI